MDPPPANPYLNHWLEAALRMMMLLLAAQRGYAGKVVGEDFASDAAAEAFRRSMEDSVLETASALYLSDEMRNDIRDNGLPYLGAVGRRLVTALVER